MALWTGGCPPHRAVFLLCTSPSGSLGLRHSCTMELLSLPSNHPKSNSRKVQDQSMNALHFLASAYWQSFDTFKSRNRQLRNTCCSGYHRYEREGILWSTSLKSRARNEARRATSLIHSKWLKIRTKTPVLAGLQHSRSCYSLH